MLKNLKSSCHGNLSHSFSILFLSLRVSQWEVLTNFFIFFSACDTVIVVIFMFKSPIRLPAHGMPISRFEFEQQVVAFEIIIHTRRFMHIWKDPCNTLVSSLLCVFFRHPPRTITTMILVFTLNDARLQDYTVTLAAYSGGSGKGIALPLPS